VSEDTISDCVTRNRLSPAVVERIRELMTEKFRQCRRSVAEGPVFPGGPGVLAVDSGTERESSLTSWLGGLGVLAVDSGFPYRCNRRNRWIVPKRDLLRVDTSAGSNYTNRGRREPPGFVGFAIAPARMA